MVRFLILSFYFIICSSFVKDYSYPVAKVKSGENVKSLLSRHLLTPHTCNMDEFKKINRISGTKLKVGKLYKLPMIIEEYNGKNIRTSVGIKDFDIAKKIEQFNLDLLKIGVRDQNFKDNKKIWVPIVEFDCTDNSSLETIETKKEDFLPKVTEELSVENKVITGTELKRKGIKTINVPLMGKGYDVVHIEDFSLAGHVYYIISGHGGIDPGAVCTTCPRQMCEDEYAYDVSLRLARNLMQHGATVHMVVQDDSHGIRDDQYLMCDQSEKMINGNRISTNQKARLQQRVAYINKMYQKYKKEGIKTQRAIEIHIDSNNKEKRQDVFFYYNNDNKRSKELAFNTQVVFEEKYQKHQPGRGYKGFVENRGIFMVKNLDPDVLFIELANIRNPADQERLKVNTNRQALANWVFEGMRK